LQLDALRRADAAAAFFLIGERAACHPDLARRIHDEGHAVGNHTWSHRALSLGACASPQRQLERTEDLLTRLCPGSPRIFRPPFGAVGPGGGSALARTGLLPVYWSVVPGDWDPLPEGVIRRRVLAGVHPGALIVLHGGRSWHAGTAAALERMVEELRDAGYEIVPLPRMLEAAGVQVSTR
jgi:peptidoglycan/xylan/chitin deacetylase (PgdA/CDA1 family)